MTLDADYIRGHRYMGFCRRFYKRYKRVVYYDCISKNAKEREVANTYSATVAKSTFPSRRNPWVKIYLDADYMHEYPLMVPYTDLQYARRDWGKAFRHIFIYGFSEWWCHRNSLQEKWDERQIRARDGYELLELLKKERSRSTINR